MSLAVWIFASAAAFLLYTLAGYPLLLAWLARRSPKPVRRDSTYRTVTVLVCVYNGEPWIRKKLASITALDYPPEKMEVLVVSDGSTDGTDEAVAEFPGVRLLRVPHGGKSAALNAGIAAATGEIVFFTDVRQPLHRDCLSSLMSCFADPSVAGATGEMVFLDQGGVEQANYSLYWRYELWIRRNLSRLDSLLTATGCVYAMRRELLVPLPPDILVDDFYLPIAAVLQGYRLVFDEGAIVYEYVTPLETDLRRKARTLAGLYQLPRAYPALMLPFRRMGLHFLSYKFARLMLPFALLAMAVAGIFLPGAWAWLVTAAQVLSYGLALADPWLPKNSVCKRLGSLARTFFVLMAASVAALGIFFMPARRLWKDATTVDV